MSFNNFYDEAGHPTNIARNNGWINTGTRDNDGIVFCGECAVENAREHHGGGWDARRSHILLHAAGWTAFDPSEGDDWCSRCDRDIKPRD